MTVYLADDGKLKAAPETPQAPEVDEAFTVGDKPVVEKSAESAGDDTPARTTLDDIVESQLVVEDVTPEARAARIRQLQADVQRGIIEIGFELIVAKKQVGHGGWAQWLQKEFEWSDRTARYFMEIAQRFGNRNTCSDLRPSTLKAMLALPEDDEQAFIEAQAQAGNTAENQSARQVQAAVKQWKKDKKKKSPLWSPMK